MSYMWYTLLGAIVSMTVALIASFFTNPIDPASLDPELLSPVIRRFLPKREVKKEDVNMALLSGYKVKKERKKKKTHTFFFDSTVNHISYRCLTPFEHIQTVNQVTVKIRYIRSPVVQPSVISLAMSLEPCIATLTFILRHSYFIGRLGSSASIVTGYRLDGPWIESR